MKEEKKHNFFSWVSRKPLFWIVSIIWGLWSGSEELSRGSWAGFLGVLFISFVFVGSVFLVMFCIKNYIDKQVDKKIKSK